jgi:hypothetical protein
MLMTFRRIALAIALITAAPAFSQTALFSGRAADTTRVQKNIVTDYGATCNGVADDTSAFLTFKAAFQSATPVQLNAPPGVNCVFTPVSGEGQFPFKGIGNLLVNFNGSTMTNGAGGSNNFIFGGKGQIYDNAHSVRLQTVSAGSSCATIITQTQVNVSNAANSAGTASFTASISGTTMTVTAVSAGTLAVGQIVFGPGSTIGVNKAIPGTVITALGSGSGGTGTYTLATSQSLGSQNFSSVGVIRLTVSSTAGFGANDTVVVRNVTGSQALTNSTNGLWWSQKVDATHLDLFQSPFNGGTYTSGGTVGGDLTSLFPVGSKVMLGGFSLQSYWYDAFGAPSNVQYFEYKTVASVNSGTQQVCFDSPLVNTYKSTWPQFNTGTFFQVDPGGPATMWVLDPSWETTQEYQNIVISNPSFQTTAQGRSIKWTNASTADATCMVPSQDETFTWDGLIGTACSIETDKLIVTFNILNSHIRKLFFQSSSTTNLVVTNSTFDQSLAGTGNSFVGNGVTTSGSGLPSDQPSMSIGAGAYGASTGAATCTNCVIANDLGGPTGYDQDVSTLSVCYTFGATGIITIPNWCSYGVAPAEMQTRWAVPRANFFLKVASGTYALGQVLDVTQTLTNTLIATSFTSGFPTAPGGSIGSISPHAAASFTCTNCTGNTNAVALSDPSCAGLPMYSCMVLPYTGGASGTTPGALMPVIGSLASITMTPHPLYGGAGTLTWALSQFNNWPFFKISDGSSISYDNAGGGPLINMMVGDNVARIITPTTVTGGQSGDVLNAPGFPIWSYRGGNSAPLFSANTSGSPVLTLKMLTNQGVVFPYLLRRDIDRSLPANDNRPLNVDIAA